MDEPITNLDAKLREQMLTEIREIQRRSGTTVLYITHDQQSALQLCDRMAIMDVLADGHMGPDGVILEDDADVPALHRHVDAAGGAALQLCDRMAIMEPGGNLCQLGTDEDIILHPANRRRPPGGPSGPWGHGASSGNSPRSR